MKIRPVHIALSVNQRTDFLRWLFLAELFDSPNQVLSVALTFYSNGLETVNL